MIKSLLKTILLLALLAIVAAAVFATSTAAPHNDAVNAMRAINTAEMNHVAKHGKYADLSTLLASSEWKAVLAENESASKKVATVMSTYKGNLVLSGDGQHYAVSLKEPLPKCGSILVSTEEGIIYTGRALGCE